MQASDGSLEAVVVTRIGPVGARFGGKVTLQDVVPPSSYRLVFAGQGGAAGFAKGEARVELVPCDGATELRYTSEASVGGKLAQVGSRLIESSARKIAEEFFTRFEAAVAEPVVQLAVPEIGAVQVAAPAATATPPPSATDAAANAVAAGREQNWWLVGALAASLVALAICALH